MNKSVFDLAAQANDVDAKIIVALERVAAVFRAALWRVGKEYKLSPLQIQVLIFLKFHDLEKRKVSYLAKEFNLSKPTISETVRTLLKKSLIEKEVDPVDTRSYSMHLTDQGNQIVEAVSFFANDLKDGLTQWTKAEKVDFYQNTKTQ